MLMLLLRPSVLLQQFASRPIFVCGVRSRFFIRFDFGHLGEEEIATEDEDGERGAGAVVEEEKEEEGEEREEEGEEVEGEEEDETKEGERDVAETETQSISFISAELNAAECRV